MIKRVLVVSMVGLSLVGCVNNDTLSGDVYDLILLDIYMQKENGLDLLPVLHNARCKSDVIVISSAADAATIKDSLHYGVVDYLIKPFQASRFEEALTGWRQKKMALEKHQYYDQAELDHRQLLAKPELQTLLHVQNRTLLLKRRKLLPYQSLKSSPRYTRLTCSSCKISVGVPWAIKCP